MDPYEVLMRGFGQFTGMLPGNNMPLNVNPNYPTAAPSPVTIGGASSPIDPIGTRSYQQLGSQVDSALQRNLPRSFTGAGIQNVPMNIIGQVSDLADMPEGAAKESARNKIQRNLRMYERVLQPPGRPAGQGPGGAFRAPGVGSNPPRSTPTTVNPRSTLPQTGGPLARDYPLGRSTGTVDQFRKLRQSAAPLPNTGAIGNRGGALVLANTDALVPVNRGALATTANQGAGYGPVNRVSVVDVTPQGTRILPGAPRAGFKPLGALRGAGRLLGPVLEAYGAYETGKEIVNPENNILGSLQNLGTSVSNLFRSPEDQQAYTGNPNSPGTQWLNQNLNKRLNRGADNTAYSATPEFIGPVPQPGAAGQYGPPTPTNEPRRGAFTIDGFNPDITIDQYREQVIPSLNREQVIPSLNREQVIPSRKNLEDRAYQQEASRLAQQDDPYFRSDAPLMNYSAEEGMRINRSLYGDMLTPNTPNPLMAGLTYDQTNPTMQGKNYNMENPVGVQQSAAQALSDYYRNGMMEQQTGFGSEPGLESVLSPEDRSMYLAQLRNFQPGGPGYGR